MNSPQDTLAVQTPQVIMPGTEEARAMEVRDRIDTIKGNLIDGMFELGDLLTEAKRNNYHVFWGYARFGDWIEQGSGLDMSSRAAYYLMNICEKSALLGISRAQLRAARISKLKEIFTLDPKHHGDKIKELVGNAPNLNIQQIKQQVAQINGDELEPPVYMTFRVPVSVKSTLVDPSFELIRREYGDKIDPDTNEPYDLSDSKCFELLCAAYALAQPEYGEVLNQTEGD